MTKKDKMIDVVANNTICISKQIAINQSILSTMETMNHSILAITIWLIVLSIAILIIGVSLI